MPGLNKTGPMGEGPMTGRRMGQCTNFQQKSKSQNEEGNTNNVLPESEMYGRGLALRRRFGFRGRGRGFGGEFNR